MGRKRDLSKKLRRTVGYLKKILHRIHRRGVKNDYKDGIISNSIQRTTFYDL